ncbi:hypothetical protein Q9L58_006193 [Maublancomyces gigas]|uniref:Uncharacterized protein n=1 Tax=Discina gigas TaxID=1032678 RepID=A0ABR3GGI2_9PEZI
MLPTSFEQQLQSLKTSVNDRKSDLDVLSTHQSSVVEADIQNARAANINAMAKLFSLVQYIQKVDDALLGRSFIGMWKSVEAIMEEEHPKIQQLMDDVEPSLAGADKVAGLALQNAMDLALRVSVFYDTKVMKLEQQLVETSDELQNVIRENTNAIAKAQASQERLANKVELKQGEKQRLGLRTSEVEYDGQNALKECKESAGLAFYAVGLGFIFPPVALLGAVVGVASGTQIVANGIKALSKFSEAAVLNDRKADVERKLQHLQHQVDQLMKKTTELERDRCKCRDMKTLFGRLESKAVNVRHTTQRLEFSLVGAKAATTYRLVKIRSARTQVNALQYVDTRERIIEILDHIAHEIRGGFVSDQSSKSWFTRLFENPYAELLYDGWFGTVSRPKRIDEFEEHRKLADGLKRIRACTPKVLKIQDQIAEASGLGCGDKRHANTFEFILPLRCTRMLGLAENFWVRSQINAVHLRLMRIDSRAGNGSSAPGEKVYEDA